MPPSLEPYEWIRPRYLKNLEEPLTVFNTTEEYPDLIKRNKHLFHSEKLAENRIILFGMDEKKKWQGWMHVYSNNKSGRNVHHHPIVNPNGKYIVRLHFLGCWRRIVVDDFIPIDKDGNPLLPTADNHFELWPILLAKGLLKIASLTWSQRKEIVDFSLISCLTGWICLSLNVIHLSPRDKWELLMKYAEHFEWTKEGTNSENVTLGSCLLFIPHR
ncbi:hypothetical protein M0802_001102 [Mischocyttarus mexicanus]|nr:hypothetical protein M0802_001102 [Mischocyttarus mexicanus]